MERAKGYWKKHLDGIAPDNPLADRSRTTNPGDVVANPVFVITKELGDQLEYLSRERTVSLFVTLLAAFKVLLYRYSGQSDICVVTSTPFFDNLLALRSTVDSDEPFDVLLQKVHETVRQAYLHGEVPFETVAGAVMNKGDKIPHALYQFMFVLQNYAEEILCEEIFENNISKFDLSFSITQTADHLQGSVMFSPGLFSEGFVTAITANYVELLHSIAQHPEQKIRTLPILAQEEKELLLGKLNGMTVEYPRDKTIINLFEEQVDKNPDGIALVFEDTQFTYRQLNEKANLLSHYLRSKGVKEETPVPVCIERSEWMIIGILGILKAGGAYVPIDPEYPEQRMQHILEDINCRVLVTSKASISVLPGMSDTETIVLDTDWHLISKGSADNIKDTPRPLQLAYIIYTSGSTGKPKGVMIQHNSLVDYVFGLKTKIQVDHCKSFALVSTISADLGNTVIYSSLAFGGTLHVLSKDAINDIEIIYDYFQKYKIECLKIVPSHWEALCTPEKMLLPSRLIIFGGEALQSNLVQTIHNTGLPCRVINHYGPTETTIGKLLHVTEKGIAGTGSTVPIGKPFSNTQVYILNDQMALCPAGMAGQLYIGGDGVARGYYNNSELTRSRFIQNPFDVKETSLLYCTGDLVKYLADGSIQFLGRVDDQVKIRGYRIELGEIESVLMQCEQVSKAVVLAKEDKDGKKRLVAYIVPSGIFEKNNLISYLQAKLPPYMLPALWVGLDHIPLTPNGKIDRKALPEPETTAGLSKDYEAPRTETEQKMAAVWQSVIDLDRIGIYDNFFDLGGHSLLAMRLISAMRRELDVEITIKDLFACPTIEELSDCVSTRGKGHLLPAIIAQHRPEYIPLSFNQERLWFVDKLEGSIQYHLPSLLRIKGRPDIHALTSAFRAIVERHEVLSTVIRERDGIGLQHIKSPDNWQPMVADVSGYQDDPDALNAYIENIVNQPFDLSSDHMLRVHVLRLRADEHLVVMILHHIASDGWSMSVIVGELVEFYTSLVEGREAQLAPLAIQYADYAIWQKKHLQGTVWNNKVNYWKGKLKGASPLDLPADYARPAVFSRKGNIVRFEIDNELRYKLHALSRQQDATLFMTLLTAFKVLLYRYSDQKDICVGTAAAGRQQHETEDLIGFFVNTLVLRSELDGAEPFTGLLKRVKGTVLEAYENQDVPFEKVVETVLKKRDISRNPIFQVMFLLQNTPDVPPLLLGDTSITYEKLAHRTAMFDLTFDLREMAAGILGEVEYCTDLYNEETMIRMIDHYKVLLAAIVKQPSQKTGALPILTKAEEYRLLVELNDTMVEYPAEKTLVDLFEEQADKNPGKTAVIFKDEQLSYRQLNEKANQVAHYLRSKGVKEETLVPLCIERSVEMIIGIMGILKAGGAYVPIDPEFPEDRIKYIMDDTTARVVVSSPRSKGNLLRLPGKPDILTINGDWKAMEKFSAGNLTQRATPGQLAYIIYTSGSTGAPKGVMVEHKSIYNYLLNSKAVFIKDGETSSGSFIHFPYTFDASLKSMFTTLVAGKSIVLSSEQSAYVFEDSNLHKYAPYDFIQLTPAHLELFYAELNDADGSQITGKVSIGGETLHGGHFDYLVDKGASLVVVNEYGPTEATVACTGYSFNTIQDDKILQRLPIGKPINNVQVYILNEHNQLVPPGIAGEICIGGVQVARGYLNLPELTNKKFITNPFDKTAGAKIYKTGDMGRWLPDGNIECLGRTDDQVKIRGYRIELGEIESTLLQSELVSQAAVITKEDNDGKKQLVAYIVPNGAFDKNAMAEYLKDKLPNYMVPLFWMEMNSFPLTLNGKIDRKSLPKVDIEEQLKGQFVAADTEEEKVMAEIWMEVLKLDSIGVEDNFFDAGGHSLLAIQIITKIEKKTQKKLPIAVLLKYPTIRSLTAFIQKNNTANIWKSLIPIKPTGTKTPLYIVHGIGLNVMNFSQLASHLDDDQPVFGLQAMGLDGIETPFDNISDMAKHFVEEILDHNPTGPYLIAGYSSGGFIAFEMVRQLEFLNKKVKTLVIIDSDSDFNKHNWYDRTIKCLLPKFMGGIRPEHKRFPAIYKRRIIALNQRLGRITKTSPTDFEQLLHGIQEKLLFALNNYQITPVNRTIYLFRPKISNQYNSDIKYLGWRKNTLQVVKDFEISGNHNTMLVSPNVKSFAGVLQDILDNSQ